MYVTKTVVVRNLSPLVVSSTSGNYVRTVDYIPGTTILGAYLSAKVPPGSSSQREWRSPPRYQ